MLCSIPKTHWHALSAAARDRYNMLLVPLAPASCPPCTKLHQCTSDQHTTSRNGLQARLVAAPSQTQCIPPNCTRRDLRANSLQAVIHFSGLPARKHQNSDACNGGAGRHPAPPSPSRLAAHARKICRVKTVCPDSTGQGPYANSFTVHEGRSPVRTTAAHHTCQQPHGRDGTHAGAAGAVRVPTAQTQQASLVHIPQLTAHHIRTHQSLSLSNQCSASLLK